MLSFVITANMQQGLSNTLKAELRQGSTIIIILSKSPTTAR